jgi:hypothetical protein
LTPEGLENLSLAVVLDQVNGDLAAEVVDGAAALETGVLVHGFHAPAV